MCCKEPDIFLIRGTLDKSQLSTSLCHYLDIVVMVSHTLAACSKSVC